MTKVVKHWRHILAVALVHIRLPQRVLARNPGHLTASAYFRLPCKVSVLSVNLCVVPNIFYYGKIHITSIITPNHFEVYIQWH